MPANVVRRIARKFRLGQPASIGVADSLAATGSEPSAAPGSAFLPPTGLGQLCYTREGRSCRASAGTGAGATGTS